jgi:hypothetical protein
MYSKHSYKQYDNKLDYKNYCSSRDPKHCHSTGRRKLSSPFDLSSSYFTFLLHFSKSLLVMDLSLRFCFLSSARLETTSYGIRTPYGLVVAASVDDNDYFSVSDVTTMDHCTRTMDHCTRMGCTTYSLTFSR